MKETRENKLHHSLMKTLKTRTCLSLKANTTRTQLPRRKRKSSAGCANRLIFGILKKMFPSIMHLEQQKRHHKETMALISFLAGDVKYWDFIGKEKTRQCNESSDPRAGLQRWNDSPLITGVKMGLYESVENTLEVYPQAVNMVDFQGKNVVQVAISLRNKQILDILASKLTGRNPLLPTPLLYARGGNNNTILHYAAEVIIDEEDAGPLQMQKELQWFEQVGNLIPRDLRYSRNAEGKTAQECFSEKHKKVARKGKEQLRRLGQIGSSLMAAFVFGSSFSIPGSNVSGGGGEINSMAAFFIYKHVFVFGLSCAVMALVLFLSLVTSSYKEREFRLHPLVCELTVFLALTLFVLLHRGCSFGATSLVHRN